MQKQAEQMLEDGTMPSPEEFARLIEGVRDDYRRKLSKLRSNETPAASRTARRPAKRHRRNFRSSDGRRVRVIGDGFGGAVDSHVDTRNAMILDPTGEGFSGHLNDPQWWIGDCGSPGFLINRNPDFKRVLGREAMEPKR